VLWRYSAHEPRGPAAVERRSATCSSASRLLKNSLSFRFQDGIVAVVKREFDLERTVSLVFWATWGVTFMARLASYSATVSRSRPGNGNGAS
jgi:hypothetical protein